jgi:DNA-binding NtrC family response regulator
MSPPKTNETILLVDDEDAVRRLLVRALRLGDYQVVEASEASEAFAALQAPDQRIDLIVSDVVMPGLDGVEFAKQVATAFPGIRILLMSGLSEEGIVAQLPETSRGGFLDKPFTPDQLLRAVRNALDTRSG